MNPVNDNSSNPVKATSGFSDPTNMNNSNMETFSFPFLVASIIHQVRIIHSHEMREGLMFYSLSRDESGAVIKVPSYYVPDARSAFYKTVEFLEMMLKPYITEKDIQEFTKLRADCESIRKKAREQWVKVTEQYPQYLELSSGTRERWVDEYLDEYRSNAMEIYKQRFELCVTILHSLGLLPKTFSKGKSYGEENII